jgi:hypothetical protein
MKKLFVIILMVLFYFIAIYSSFLFIRYSYNSFNLLISICLDLVYFALVIYVIEKSITMINIKNYDENDI